MGNKVKRIYFIDQKRTIRLCRSIHNLVKRNLVDLMKKIKRIKINNL